MNQVDIDRVRAEAYNGIYDARQEAHAKAIDSLARYKFWMFGYHAAAWVRFNKMLPEDLRSANPFRNFVNEAKAQIKMREAA